MRAFEGRLGEQNAVVSNDTHRAAPDMRKSAHQGRAVVGFKLVKVRAVDESSDDLTHVVRLAVVLRQNPVNLSRVKFRLARLTARKPRRRWCRQRCEN